MVDVSPQTIHEEYGGPSIKLNVLGSTGNVYEVTISKVPKCSCPDAMKVCLSFVVLIFKQRRYPICAHLLILIFVLIIYTVQRK